MAKILLIGDDPVLLATRAAILATTGADVSCCSSSHIPEDSDPHVTIVVLCHTVKEQRAHEIRAEARSRWPQARIVQLVCDWGRYPSLYCENGTTCLDGPAQLMEFVASTLRSA